MGGAVTIGLLMMASRAMPEGCWEFVVVWESGCDCLDVSPRPKVLTLFGGIRCIDGLGGGEVGGLHVEYWRWGGLEGTPPSKDRMVGAWDESWGAEALGWASRDTDGSIWPPLMRAMVEMRRETEVSSSNWWSWGVEWKEICFARWRWAFRNKEWAVRNK